MQRHNYVCETHHSLAVPASEVIVPKMTSGRDVVPFILGLNL